MLRDHGDEWGEKPGRKDLTGSVVRGFPRGCQDSLTPMLGEPGKASQRRCPECWWMKQTPKTGRGRSGRRELDTQDAEGKGRLLARAQAPQQGQGDARAGARP